MIFNNSMIRFNVTFKGREYGFAPYETKRFKGKMTEKEEKMLANKYTFLIYKPDTKKEIMKEEVKSEKNETSNTAKLEQSIKEKIVEEGKSSRAPVDPEPVVEQFEDLYNTRESIIIAEKESIVIKEDDIINVVEEVENIPLDTPVRKTIDSMLEEYNEAEEKEDVKEDVEAEEEKETKKTTKKSTKKTTKKSK